MRAVKSTNTKSEVALAKALYVRGYRYRKNNKSVLGKPDITFKNIKLAIFIDGEFWHGKDWGKKKFEIKSNRDFWFKKIEANIKRDKKVRSILKKEGWRVLRFWDKSVEKSLGNCILKIENEIKRIKLAK